MADVLVPNGGRYVMTSEEVFVARLTTAQAGCCASLLSGVFIRLAAGTMADIDGSLYWFCDCSNGTTAGITSLGCVQVSSMDGRLFISMTIKQDKLTACGSKGNSLACAKPC